MAITLDFSGITLEMILGGVLIAFARIFDVSLSVLRMSAQAAGRRKAAWGFAFLESLIWVVVVSSIVTNLSHPVYAIFYALGFATGTLVGVALEDFFARGEQVVRIFTHSGDSMAAHFREKGFRVTQFEGKGRDGPIQLLFIHMARKQARRVPPEARKIDDACFIVVDDVRGSVHGRSAGTSSHAQRK
ncbi:MAG: DUF2179 domain-containing protein [Planctomycetes bacterium]|nr:DUF2179 domain-containing protein [Planctomycetota bacterium]